MQVLNFILYFVLFVVFLSILITIHELGHFTAAKIFKVYCKEFSIGFGPKLIHVKRKTGETYFSLRAVPFGGYVSMYGEGVELPEGVEIDESRSLEGVAKWKRAIILFAGVFNNAILAIVLFFISAFIPSKMCYYGNMSIAEGSKAAEAGLQTGQIIALDEKILNNETQYVDSYHLFDNASVVTLNDETKVDAFAYINLTDFTDYSDLDLSHFMALFNTKIDDGKVVVNWSSPITINDEFKSVSINIKTVHYIPDESGNIDYSRYELIDHPISIGKDETGKQLESFGYNFYLADEYAHSFGEAFKSAFKNFGSSSTLIVRTMVSLFTSKDTWNNVGGIVAIGVQSSNILKNFGWGKFLYMWAAISVNLAIVNLIPFPGLDGWQLLVLLVEAIAHKKIPNKVKNIVSFIGLVLLFGFMIVILVKDVITFIL